MMCHLLDYTLQTFAIIGPAGRGIKPWLFPRLRDGERDALKSEARMDDSIGAAQMVAVLVIPVPCIMHLLPSLLGRLMPRWLARLAKLTAMCNPEVKSGHTPSGVRVTAHHSKGTSDILLVSAKHFRMTTRLFSVRDRRAFKGK
jgi:hypothetical protein